MLVCKYLCSHYKQMFKKSVWRASQHYKKPVESVSSVYVVNFGRSWYVTIMLRISLLERLGELSRGWGVG